jgi:hypothetical protein
MGVINDAVSRYNSNNSASVSSYSTTDTSALYSFVSKYKKASKGLGAFDDSDAKGSPENTVFGISDTAGHFDKYLAELVNTYASSYYSNFTSDLASTNVDAVGKSVQKRLMMYTPHYFLIDNNTYYGGGGSGSSDVAPYWRIRTGINQSDAPLNTEIDLALALQNYSGVKSVDFETIWGLAHTQAEDKGNANTNFIAWVEKCAAATATGISSATSKDAIKRFSVKKCDKGWYSIAMPVKGVCEITLISCNGRVASKTSCLGNSCLISVKNCSPGIYYVTAKNCSFLQRSPIYITR